MSSHYKRAANAPRHAVKKARHAADPTAPMSLRPSFGAQHTPPSLSAQQATAFALSAAMMASATAPAFAATYYLNKGDITITKTDEGTYVKHSGKTYDSNDLGDRDDTDIVIRSSEDDEENAAGHELTYTGNTVDLTEKDGGDSRPQAKDTESGKAETAGDETGKTAEDTTSDSETGKTADKKAGETAEDADGKTSDEEVDGAEKADEDADGETAEEEVEETGDETSDRETGETPDAETGKAADKKTEETAKADKAESRKDAPAAKQKSGSGETAADKAEEKAETPAESASAKAEKKAAAKQKDDAPDESTNSNKSALEKAADNFAKAANDTIHGVIKIINYARNKPLEVTLDNAKVDATGTGKAALTVEGNDVDLKLVGENELTGDKGKSALTSNLQGQTRYGTTDGTGTLTISGEDGASLTAKGGAAADGIFSRNDLTITSGTINATGGDSYATTAPDGELVYLNGGDGIRNTNGTLEITGGTINATGGQGARHEDGGDSWGGSGILSWGSTSISGGTITATGGGGERGGNGLDFTQRYDQDDSTTISGGTITATGGDACTEAHPELSSSLTHPTGGRGITSNGDLTISGGNITSAVGGNGCFGGDGIDVSGELTITDATLGTIQGGGSGDQAIGGAGINADDVIIGGTTHIDSIAGADGAKGGSGIRGQHNVTIRDDVTIGSIQGGNARDDSTFGNPHGGNGIIAVADSVTIQDNADIGTVKGGNGVNRIGNTYISDGAGLMGFIDVVLKGNVKADIAPGTNSSAIIRYEKVSESGGVPVQKKLSDFTELGEDADVILRDANGTILESTKNHAPDPEPTPTPDPEPTPTPDPTPDPEPTPTPDPTPDPEPTPTPDRPSHGGSDSDNDSGTLPAAPEETAAPAVEETHPWTLGSVVITPDSVSGITVTGLNGGNVPVETSVEDAALHLTADRAAVTMRTTVGMLRTLKESGVQTLTLRTKMGTVALPVEELLALCGPDDSVELVLSHYGPFSRLTLGGSDVSYLLR